MKFLRNNIKAILIFLIPVLLISVWLFYDNKNIYNVRYEKSEETTSQTDNAPETSEVTTEILKEGEGERLAVDGDTLRVQYRGTLASNGQEFDESYSEGDEGFIFNVGQGVITGWSEGVIGMKKNEIRRINIPSEKGYGSAGAPPTIPANADLIFEVELLEFL